jgi:hypothetical protein
MNSSATIIEGRQRSSDRWILFKFPERSTVVRSAEAAREISLGSKKRSPDTRSCHWDISHREIGVLKVMRTGTMKVSISRHNWDHPFERTHGSDRAPPGEARRRLHWRIENRSFTSPVNNYNRNPKIAMKEIPTEPEPSDQHVI